MSCFQSFDTGVEVSSSNGLWTVAGHQGREGMRGEDLAGGFQHRDARWGEGVGGRGGRV